jgi:bacillolysin
MRNGVVVALIMSTGVWVHSQSAAPVSRVTRVIAGSGALEQGRSNASALSELRAWDSRISDLERGGDLRRLPAVPDDTTAGRIDQRFEQRHLGVRVFGGSVTRQLNRFGQAESVFGAIYADVGVDTRPALSAEAAAARLAAAGNGGVMRTSPVELVILPRDDGTYRLTYSARVFSSVDGWIRRVFVDADSGATVDSYIDTWTQTPAVGTGTGVLGDTKKMMAGLQGSTYLAADMLRPPDPNTHLNFPRTGLLTFDFKGVLNRSLLVLQFPVTPALIDIAADSDNAWTDTSIVDAHTHAGYTYDFYYKRYGRKGLDNANLQQWLFTNPVKATDWPTLFSQWGGTFFLNAFYMGDGNLLFGVGLPPGITSGGKQWFPFAGALDVVAHEVTHGVTDYTSSLIYVNEPGALNESFSDMMSVAVEFDFQPVGSALGQADWLQGEDIARPGGIRSLANPFSFGHPDHYSVRYTGNLDNGGVHINSSIVNHMFYLAIMGGTNRVSQQTVTGVGFANRKLIENTIYRAFTALIPASATFGVARAATIQAARDLYGTNSEAERALTAAWSAVGVS